MANDTTARSWALRRAIELVGGIDALSKELQVPAVDVSIWLQGDVAPPTFVFLKLVDLLIAHGADDQTLPQARRDS